MQIGVECEIAPGDNVQEAIEMCRNFVTLQSSETKNNIRNAETITNNPDDYRGSEVKRAKAYLDEMSKAIQGIQHLRLSNYSQECKTKE